MHKNNILETLKNSSTKEIEEFCNLRFQQNLKFFSIHYPNLFETLKNPAKEYQLYIGGEGVNIFNFQQNTMLFPIKDGKSTMVEIHENCAFNPATNARWNRIYGGEVAMDEKDFPFSGILVQRMLCYAREKIKEKGANTYYLPSDFLPSLSLFGLGGGIFLQVLAERYAKIHNFFIFEESFDLFRIACFFVNFALLFSKTAHKAGYIFLESMLNRDYLQHFFEVRRIGTSIVRFECMFYQTEKNKSAQNLVREMHGQVLRGWGTFEDEMQGIKNKLSTKITTMLVTPKRVNAPICVVANGPSLDFLLPFIKKNQNKMIIFSCGTALKPLLNAKIKPDFQIEIERHNYLGDVLKEAPLGDIPLLCASVLDKKAKELAKEIYCFERDGSSAAHLNAPKFRVRFTAPIVGNAGASLACYLGSDVILCGLDCGYKKGQKKHAKNSYYENETAEIPKDAYLVAGNFSEDIYSDSLYSLSRTALEEAFRALKPFCILNLNDGARIQGAQAVHYEDFELKEIDKKKAIKQIKSLFKDPIKEGFYTKDTQKYFFEILAFKNKIHDLFKTTILTKKELFAMLDTIYENLAKEGQKNPFIGILFGGSLSHFLYSIALGSLYLSSDAVENLWKYAQELYVEAMDKMLEHLREVLLEKVEH